MPRSQRPRIHLTALATSAVENVDRLTSRGIKGLIDIVQQAVGSDFQVTADDKLIQAKQDDQAGGRSDDDARARALQRVLADDNVAAMVTLRGGGWFTRILDRVDFSVLQKRKRTIHLFGFSEMTSLINIAGRYPKAVGLYDLGPGFLYDGLQWYARNNIEKLTGTINGNEDNRWQEGFISGWSLGRYEKTFIDFFLDVAGIVCGEESQRPLTGKLLAGDLPGTSNIQVVGGNLAVMMPLLSSPYAEVLNTNGKWLAIEEINESPSSIDRMLTGLRMAGLFDKVKGILLGDFHEGTNDLNVAAFSILKKHLPSKLRIPVVRLEGFGHVWPMSPLPMHREITLRCKSKAKGRPDVRLEIPWDKWTNHF